MGDGADYGTEELYEADLDRSMEREELLAAWDRAKKAPGGSVIPCPVCHRRFRKLRWGHVFCRHKGQGNCKDRFWNTVNDDRRERAAMMNQ
jgi:hypothetical protein